MALYYYALTQCSVHAPAIQVVEADSEEEAIEFGPHDDNGPDGDWNGPFPAPTLAEARRDAARREAQARGANELFSWREAELLAEELEFFS